MSKIFTIVIILVLITVQCSVVGTPELLNLSFAKVLSNLHEILLLLIVFGNTYTKKTLVLVVWARTSLRSLPLVSMVGAKPLADRSQH